MESFQTPVGTRSSGMLETSCGYLLQELQMIWDEIGEDQFEREKVLVDLEQECLEVYRRKVDNANMSRSRLHQELADSEAEFTHLLLSLGERSLPGRRPEKMSGTLKEQLSSIAPALREMQLRKEERMKQFRAVQGQIHKISAEIAGQSEYDDSLPNLTVTENDLSLKKLEEYQAELQRLHNEKSDRLQRVENYISTIQNLAATLGTDSSMIITKVHPSLNELSGLSKNISDGILAKLNSTVESLESEKQMRIEKLQHLGTALTNLWNIMSTPYKDRQPFYHVTGSVSSAEISTPGCLAVAIIEQAEAEVKRLDQLKASKMEELLVKKQIELEEICSQSHMEVPSQSEMKSMMNLINSGEIDYDDLLTRMDEQILRAEEEASSRKIIMEKMEKWVIARDEERWLEEYNRDENRYSVSRGAHKNLKRAERARVMVNKIPALVDSLIAKTKSWEEERKKVFLYDEVPLLAMMEEYNISRHEKEEEKQRQKEKKKVQARVPKSQENAFVTRPSTSYRRLPDRSFDGSFTDASPLHKRFSMGQGINAPSQSIPFVNKGKRPTHQKKLTPTHLDFPLREDQTSVLSTFSSPISP